MQSFARSPGTNDENDASLSPPSYISLAERMHQRQGEREARGRNSLLERKRDDSGVFF